jgi:hypothetical protein
VKPAAKTEAITEEITQERSEVRAVSSEHRETLASIDLELEDVAVAPPLPPQARVTSVAPPPPVAVAPGALAPVAPVPLAAAPLAALAEIPEPPPSNRIPSMRISTRDVIEHVQRISSPPPPPASIAPAPIAAFVPPTPPQTLLAPVDPFASVQAPAPAPAPRLTITDPTDVLFDAMYDLGLFETAVEGASYCLASILRALPSRAGMIHLFDTETREFVTVYAQGPGSDELLMNRHSDEDWLISAAICKHKPLIMSYGDEVGGRPLDRHAKFGAIKSVLVAPVFSWGRCLGVIELVDPTDGSQFDDRRENAIAYAADRYGEFLGERGVHVGTVAPPSGIISKA